VRRSVKDGLPVGLVDIGLSFRYEPLKARMLLMKSPVAVLTCAGVGLPPRGRPELRISIEMTCRKAGLTALSRLARLHGAWWYPKSRRLAELCLRMVAKVSLNFAESSQLPCGSRPCGSSRCPGQRQYYRRCSARRHCLR
jgi:hypothetical protein